MTVEERIRVFKAALSAAMALLTTLWGWFGWLIVAWVVCMGLDYLTGTLAALKTGTWASKKARDGLWRKTGCIVAVTAAGVLDLVAGHLLGGVPAALPFEYTVFLCPLVVVWYILTEAGSIIENAGELGAPIPGWLKKAVAVLKDRVDKTGEDR